MGYNVYITRADEWYESEANPISVDEWLNLIEEDPELTLTPEPEFDRPYVALWSGPSEYSDLWFNLWQGRIFTKNADEPMIDKMCLMALTLRANVQGEDPRDKIFDARD